MELRIVHTTGFEYSGLATASYNQARMTPQTSPEQIVVHTRLEVAPSPWTFEYRDYFGNEVNAFEVLDPHEQMTVTATSTVHTQRRTAPEPVLAWSDLGTPDVADRWTEYLELPALVSPADDLAERIRTLGRDAARPGEAARAVCELVNTEVEYISGATDATSTATDAWQQRGGVCQDMAHLVIGSLRTLGIPTRYVSGYLHPTLDPVVGETTPGESHAWVEWWDDGWHAFDPTNDLEPGDRWVVVATGRDYLDVKPLSGIYSGAGTSSMFVRVDVTLLA
jgi:transglutaminase-like putative cysteine protease